MAQLTIKPDRLHKGFNNSVFGFMFTDDDIAAFGKYYEIFVNSLQLKENSMDEYYGVTLERVLTPITKFNLRAVLAPWFQYRSRVKLPSNVILDYGLFKRYTVEYKTATSDGAGWYNIDTFNTGERYALNAAEEYISGNTSMMQYQGHVLMRAHQIKKYAGYPLVVTFLNFQTGRAWLSVNGVAVTPENDPITAQIFCITIGKDQPISDVHIANYYEPNPGTGGSFVWLRYPRGESEDNDGWITEGNKHIIIDLIEEQQTANGVTVDSNTCGVDTDEAQHYVWVRWINDIAGYEYAMFAHRHTEILELNGATNFCTSGQENFVTDFEQAVAKDLVRSITVGMEGVPDTELIRVQGILKSPLIEMYSEQRFIQEGGIEGLHGWVPLTVNKSKAQRNSRETQQRFEATLNFPPVQSQFV